MLSLTTEIEEPQQQNAREGETGRWTTENREYLQVVFRVKG